MPVANKTGKKIEKKMNEKGWSQNKLAEESDLQPSTVNHIINGGDPQVSTLKKIAKALKVNPEEIM